MKTQNLNFITLYIFLMVPAVLFGQGIRGTVKSADGKPLPYASVFVVSLKSGTSAGEDGRFQLKLEAGDYILRVQNIGYKAQEYQFSVKDEWVEKDFLLSAQGYMLNEVQVGKSRKEDFAYTIIRKAIAKKKYHQLQYTSYEMKVYIKGTGELTKAPFFLKNKLKKEGVNINEAYTTESVSHIKFKQPNKIDERVIAIRTKGSNNSGVSPSMFINQSFYADKIAGVISPLSRTAFRWYRFTYEGSFSDGKHEVNKIRVTPRSRGDNVFEGTLYLIEDEWAIHSLDLKTSVMGFPISVRQNYGEVAPNVWMPVTHRYQFAGNVLGFEGHYNYLASCREYKVELNKDLIFKADVVDEKVEPAPQEIAALKQRGKAPAEMMPPTAKMSRKQFYKMMDRYEKESLKQKKDSNVISNLSFNTDTNATRRDSSYWDEVRSVPLSEKERQGYRRDDSLAAIQAARLAGKDSLKVIKKKRFSPLDIIGGSNYNLSARTTVQVDPALTQFYYNTVEGFNINLSGKLKYQYDSLRRRWEFSPALRYGFSSRDLYFKGRLSYGVRKAKFALEGGKFVEQFNQEEAIHPLINSLISLAARRNYMKLYEKTYSAASFTYRMSPFLRFEGGLEWAQRRELSNTSDYSFFYRNSRDYSSNVPQNVELAEASFPKHEALILNTSVRYRPWASYRIFNGRRIPVTENSPEFSLLYTKGIKGALASDVDFDRLEAGLSHRLTTGAAGKLDFQLKAGTYLNNSKVYFMDYKHFDGNRTFLSTMRPAGGFRLLDYYLYSTDNNYFSANTHYQFRKFLLTRIPGIRYRGLKENLFFNYLKTSNSPNYFEAGYSLDNVFRIFRLELGASFINGRYSETGLRIGIATVFRVSSGD